MASQDWIDGKAEVVRQLCRMTSRRPPYWVVVFEAYMDETGTHDGAPVTGVSLYLANSQQWYEFTRAWLLVLKKPEFDIEVFHQKDYENFKGEFKGWTVERKEALAQCLFPLLPANTWTGVGYAVINQDWDDALHGHDDLRASLGTPYMLCFQGVVERVLKAFEYFAPDERIALFCEDNDYKAQVLDCWNNWIKKHDGQDRLIALTFGGKKDFVPLQAADSLAYESYKALDNQRFGKRRKRRSLEVMQSTGNLSLLYWDRINLPSKIAELEQLLLHS